MIETLQEDFARMLLAAKTGESGEQLLKGLQPAEGNELLQLAVQEGLLIPLT